MVLLIFVSWPIHLICSGRPGGPMVSDHPGWGWLRVSAWAVAGFAEFER